MLGYTALTIICIALTITTFLFIAEPGDLIRDQLVARTKAATGRDLSIRGTTRFTFFPSIGVAMSDVSLSPPPGMTGRPTIAMKRLNVKLSLMPLLKRQIVVEQLVLSAPIIDLHVDKAGRKSWDFAAITTTRRRAALDAAPVRLAQAGSGAQKNDALPLELRNFVNGSSAARAARSPLAMLDGLSLADVRIVNGALRYSDDVGGRRQSVKAINLKIALKSIISPLTASGNFNWQGEKIALNGTVQSLKALLEERPVNLTARISARPFMASYDGGITLGSGLDLTGRLAVKSPSARKLALWLGNELPASQGFGAVKLDGRLKASARTIDLRRSKLEFDGATAIGNLGITLRRTRPLLHADLQLTKLDLNKYLPQSSETAGTAPATSGRAVKGRPQVRGYRKRSGGASGWSRAAIDLSGLGAIDADVRLGIGQLFYKDLKASKAQLAVKLVSGRLTANLQNMQFYGGRGSVFFTASRLGRAANISSQIRLSDVSGLPLLRDAAKFERLDGRGTLRLEVAGQGSSQAQIIASLLGNGSFTFTDGAIVGINIPKMIRGLQNGQLTNLKAVKSERTDFSSLTATFQITKGIVHNNDLKLIGPLLRMSGGGTISLPPRRLDYTVRPTVIASLQGQGRGAGQSSSPLAGLEIPLRIHGSWDNPKVAADFGAIARDPNKALKTIKQIGKSFKGKSAKKALNDLLGKGGSSKAKSLLNGLFR